MEALDIHSVLQPPHFWTRANRITLPLAKLIHINGIMDYNNIMLLDKMTFVRFMLEREPGLILSFGSRSGRYSNRVRYRVKLRDSPP